MIHTSIISSGDHSVLKDDMKT